MNEKIIHAENVHSISCLRCENGLLSQTACAKNRFLTYPRIVSPMAQRNRRFVVMKLVVRLCFMQIASVTP